MLTAPSLSRSDLHWAYVYRVLGWVNDFQQSGSILRQRQQSSSTTRYAHAFTIDKYVIKSKVRRDGILAVLLKMRLDLEIIEETITREDLCGFLAMCGLRSETHPRCSTLFLFELYIRARTTVVPGDPMKIIAEVQAMEGYGRASRTKEGRPQNSEKIVR